MANFTAEQVLERLREQILDPKWIKKARRNAGVAEALSELEAKDIYFGDSPVFVRGQVEGSSTAVGKKTTGDSEIQRTVSFDFITDEHLFISDNNRAELSVCKAATRCYSGRSDILHTKREARDLAYEYGKHLCRKSLYDLNFNMKEYRLNRYRYIENSGDVYFDFYPAYARIKTSSGKEKELLLGYCYVNDGESCIDITASIPADMKFKLLFGLGIAAALVALFAVLSVI